MRPWMYWSGGIANGASRAPIRRADDFHLSAAVVVVRGGGGGGYRKMARLADWPAICWYGASLDGLKSPRNTSGARATFQQMALPGGPIRAIRHGSQTRRRGNPNGLRGKSRPPPTRDISSNHGFYNEGERFGRVRRNINRNQRIGI